MFSWYSTAIQWMVVYLVPHHVGSSFFSTFYFQGRFPPDKSVGEEMILRIVEHRIHAYFDFNVGLDFGMVLVWDKHLDHSPLVLL